VDVATKVIADYGVAIAALVAITIFAWRIVREYIDDLKAQRDAQVEINRGTSAVFGRITERLDDIFEAVSTRRPR
jgi:hypothetical protein